MKCQKCGADIAENSKFCGYCGNSVNVSAPVNETMNNEVNLDQTTRIDQNMTNQSVENNTTNTQMNNPQGGKKNNKLIFIIGGAVLAAIAIIVTVVLLLGSGSSIKVLEKALNNFKDTAGNSGTVNAKLSMSVMGSDMDFSAYVKYQKVAENKTNLQLGVNKSLLTEEMNVYAEIGEKELTAYIESTLLDLTGTTSSFIPMWLYQTVTLDDVAEEGSLDDIDISLKDFIDKEHFVFVESKDGVKQYQLIIDKSLLQKIIDEAKKMGVKKYEEMEKTLNDFKDTYKINFYISKSNELKKVEIDLSETVMQMGIPKLVFSMEFSDLNNTIVSIPSEAKNATMTIEEYKASYSILEEPSTEIEVYPDFDTSLEPEIDSEWDTEFDSGVDFGI